jgi:hypothetical protein
METHSNNLIKWTGYRQLVFTGDIDSAKLQKQKSDVGVAFVVSPVAGQSTPTVNSFEMTNDPNVLLNAISKIKATLADNHGVSYSADALTAQRQTAEAMTINRQQILDIRKEVIPMFREAEKNLAWKTVIVSNTPIALNGLGMNIDITGEFTIDYQEPKFTTDPKQELEVDILKVSQGIMSQADLMIKYNPDIKSEQQAIDYSIHNKEITKQMMGVSEVQKALETRGVEVKLNNG